MPKSNVQPIRPTVEHSARDTVAVTQTELLQVQSIIRLARHRVADGDAGSNDQADVEFALAAAEHLLDRCWDRLNGVAAAEVTA